jgi:peroxiredoxin
MFSRNARIALAALSAVVLQAATIPRPAPDLAIGMKGGNALHPNQYKGKVVVVAFILTTCSHCQRTTGYLNKLQKELGPRGLQVVESAIESNAENSVGEFAKRFETPYPVGFNSVMEALNFMQHPTMQTPHMPLLAFLDRKGMIRAQHEGNEDFFGDQQEQNLRKEIEALLKEGAPAAGAKKAAPVKKGSL